MCAAHGAEKEEPPVEEKEEPGPPEDAASVAAALLSSPPRPVALPPPAPVPPMAVASENPAVVSTTTFTDAPVVIPFDKRAAATLAVIATIYCIASVVPPAALPLVLQRVRSAILLPFAVLKLGIAKLAVSLTRQMVA